MGHGLSTASLFPSYYTLPFSHGPPAISSSKFKQAPPKHPSSSQWHSFIAFGRLTLLALVFTSFPFHCLTVSSLPPFHTICLPCTPYTFLVFKSSSAPGSRPKPQLTVHHSPFTIHHLKNQAIRHLRRPTPSAAPVQLQETTRAVSDAIDLASPVFIAVSIPITSAHSNHEQFVGTDCRLESSPPRLRLLPILRPTISSDSATCRQQNSHSIPKIAVLDSPIRFVSSTLVAIALGSPPCVVLRSPSPPSRHRPRTSTSYSLFPSQFLDSSPAFLYSSVFPLCSVPALLTRSWSLCGGVFSAPES